MTGTDRPPRLRCPSQPPVHGRVRDARLSRRCRGRTAGDLAEVGRRRPRRLIRDQRAYLVRITSRQALNRLRTSAAARSRTSVSGCPSRCSPRRMWPRTSSWPTASRWRCCSSWRPSSRPSARSSCCVRSSPSSTTRSRKPWTRHPAPSARSPTAPAPTSRPAAPAQTSPPAENRAALDAFQRAIETGDLQTWSTCSRRDVVFLGDGGGVVQAVLEPIVGAERVATFLSRGRARFAERPIQLVQINGQPAFRIGFDDKCDGEFDTIMALRVEGGRVSGLYVVRNPEEAVPAPRGDHAEPMSPSDSWTGVTGTPLVNQLRGFRRPGGPWRRGWGWSPEPTWGRRTALSTS